MATLDIRKVGTRGERRVFLTFPWRIYRGDPLWVPPLLPDRAAATDPQRGAFFKHGDAEFFIAWRGREPVGTICCAEDRAANATRTWRDSLIGFFECMDDDAVAAALFDHAAGWARARGLDTLYGPFNLDYEDAYGVLLEGRDRPPALLCGHTPPYYPRFFDAYGFEPARGTTWRTPSTSTSRRPNSSGLPDWRNVCGHGVTTGCARLIWRSGTRRSIGSTY